MKLKKYKHTLCFDEEKVKIDNNGNRIGILPPNEKSFCFHSGQLNTIFFPVVNAELDFFSVANNEIKEMNLTKIKKCNVFIWKNNETILLHFEPDIKLSTLNLWGNKIQSLDFTEAKIKVLNAANNNLTELFLPEGLRQLNISNNLLETLENLPKSLRKFVWRFSRFERADIPWFSSGNENKLYPEQFEKLVNLKVLSLHYALSTLNVDSFDNTVGDPYNHFFLDKQDELVLLDLKGVFLNGDLILSRRNSKLQVFKLEDSDIKYLIFPENLYSLRSFDYINCNNKTTFDQLNETSQYFQITEETKIINPERKHTTGLSFDFFTTFLKTPNIKKVFIKNSLFEITNLPAAVVGENTNPFIFHFNSSLEQLVLNKIKIKVNNEIQKLKMIYLFDDKPSLLKTLDLYNNDFNFIDVSKFLKLRKLNLSMNKIPNLDISSNSDLEYLDISHTKIKEIDISKNKKLKKIILNRGTKIIGDTSNLTIIEKDSVY